MARPSKRRVQEQYENRIRALITDAARFVDDELTPQRALASKYYAGEPFGNEEEGRSQFIVTEVRDGIEAVVPQLARVFFGPEHVVEFVPRSMKVAEQARMETDYVRTVIEQNDGFLKCIAVMKDGLIRRVGAVKWAWVEGEREAHCLYNVTEDEAIQLVLEPGVEITEITPNDPDEENPDAPPTFKVEFTQPGEGHAEFWPIPPEEFICSRDARDMKSATLVGHRTELTRSQLLKLGVSERDIDEYGGTFTDIRDSEERLVRQETLSATSDDTDELKGEDKHLYVEAYILVDKDGKGETLRRITTLGPTYHVLTDEPADERPLAIYSPVPEPHRMIGWSWADRLMDMQKVNSMLVRSILDSLAASIFPRTAYVEGQANVDDILNTAIGAPIRMRAPGMVTPFTHEFTGAQALPVLDYMNSVVERRTGQNKGVIGLDQDALQSSTQSAVAAATTAAQAQAELLARVFAEQFFKPLMLGIRRLLIKHQPKETLVRLRGRWEKVDPRHWNADVEVSVQVALGLGMPAERAAQLIAIAEKQEQIIQTLGPDNPLCDIASYRETLVRAARWLGFSDADTFFHPVPEGWAPTPPPPQPTPEQVLAEAQLRAEQIKSEREFVLKQAEIDLKKQIAIMEHERQVAKQNADAELKRLELELKAQAIVDEREQLENEQVRREIIEDHIIAANHQKELEDAAAAAQAAEIAAQQEAAAQEAQPVPAPQQQAPVAMADAPAPEIEQ